MNALTRRTMVFGALGLAVTARASSNMGLSYMPDGSPIFKVKTTAIPAGKSSRVIREAETIVAAPPPSLSSEPMPDRFARSMSSDDLALQREIAKAAQERDPRSHGFGSLQLFREANGESIATRYRTDEGYYKRELAELSWFWRDVADGDQAVWVEPALFDYVSSVQSTMSAIHGRILPFILTSGYRTPAHNATVEGAARNSEHKFGRAGDFKAPGYPARAIAIAGMTFKGGGVGVYQRFTHLDVGTLRCWPRGCNELVARNG